MKKGYPILIVCLIIFFSCTSEDTEEQIVEPTSLLEKIVGNSPWTYDRLEVVSILETNGYDLQQSEIDDFENETNQEFNEFTISFNDNGTGTDTDGEFIWEWIDEETGEMRIWDDNYFISINNAELILGVRNFVFIPEGECCVEIRYNGNIILK
ncbi:hypothetical protein SAMN04488009_2160 [Maribacter sedimenticola]|uniref:Lipocalin-like domain-containing protein n=1 Tax=Maribacter sedimenticola TaxID=228956 RepID=A0ABY1SHA4_9FLAO|nr:hypothetical protein [Maribacter sedimenticola]SNR52992.1 hypothetical protein SAMN04488009_2160 [Maribacter sedimenticola]